MQTNKPSDDGGGKGLTASPSAPSDSTRDPIRMGALLSDVDEKYRAFSDAVYVRLRMPLDMNIRERKRQRGVFSSRLRGLLEMARGLHSHAGSPDAIPAGHPDQWPQWLVDFVGKRLRKASSLAGDPEYGQPDKVIARAKMWTADFAKTQDVLLQKHCGPADLTIGEDQ